LKADAEKQSTKRRKYSVDVSLDPKVAIDIGRGLVTLLLGIAAFLLTVLSIFKFEEDQKGYIPIILLLSSLTILLAARIIDWMLDRISLQSWVILYQIQNTKDLVNFERDFKRWDGAYFRARIYGGAYLVFSVIISFVAAASLYFAIERAQAFGLLFSVSEMIGIKAKFKILVCSLLFLYIPYEMLTTKSKWGRYFFFGAVFVIAVLVIEALIRNW